MILFQLPPNLKKDTPRLTHVLEMLPDGTRAAFEFRHETWKDDEIYDALRARDMALVCADTDDSGNDEPLVATASWGYLRLRRPDYDDADLGRWAEVGRTIPGDIRRPDRVVRVGNRMPPGGIEAGGQARTARIDCPRPHGSFRR